MQNIRPCSQVNIDIVSSPRSGYNIAPSNINYQHGVKENRVWSVVIKPWLFDWLRLAAAVGANIEFLSILNPEAVNTHVELKHAVTSTKHQKQL